MNMPASPASTQHPPPGQAQVEAVFGRIARNMADLPVYNPALAVELLGLRPWQTVQLGVLVTPWMMSLLLLPGAPGSLVALGPDQKQTWRFPAGDFAFYGRTDDALGVYQTCSLFSPMFDFLDQSQARATALACLEAVMHSDPPEAATVQAATPAAAQPGLSRRAFLGRLSGMGGMGGGAEEAQP